LHLFHIVLREWHAKISEISIEKYHYRSLTLATVAIVNILILHINCILFFSILNDCEFSGHILLQTPLVVKCHVNSASGFQVLCEGQKEEGIERNSDGWTKIEMQTFTFATFANALKNVYFTFLIICE
jgi:hypothetical protein